MMGETEPKEIPIILQPDLLSREELIDILKPRCFSRDPTSLDKYELVDLFNRVVLPLPQRVYMETWRGTRLNNKRKREESLKPAPQSSQSENLPKNSGKKQHNGMGRNLIYKPLSDLKIKSTLSDTPPAKIKDPPKPLPDQINYERKTIKLSGIKASNSKSDVDKVVIKKRKEDACQEVPSDSEQSLKPSEKARRRISYNSDESSPSKEEAKDGAKQSSKLGNTNKEVPKDVIRKRPLITAPDCSPGDKDSSAKKSKKTYSR